MANLEELSEEKEFGTFNDIAYHQIRGQFSGVTSMGKYIVPYEMTMPRDASQVDRIVVEPPHFADGTIVLKSLGAEFLFGSGLAHASVGFGFKGLNILDPNPGFQIVIAGQNYPGATSSIVDYEIIAEFAKALRGDSRSGRIYSAGFSDSGAAVRGVLTADFGLGAFNLSLPGLATKPFTPLKGSGQVMVFNSEFDYAPVTDASRDCRRYAFAGAPHIPDNEATRPAAPPPPDSPVPSVAWTSPINWVPFFKALLIAGDAWITKGIEPPASNVLKMTPSGNIARDEMSNAIGGIRHPALELVEARFIDSVVRGKNWRTLFGAYGHLRQLAYGEFESYLEKFTGVTQELVGARYLLQEDAEDWIKKAGLTPESKPTAGKTFSENYAAQLFFG